MRDYSFEGEQREQQYAMLGCGAVLFCPLVIAIGYLLHIGWRLAS